MEKSCSATSANCTLPTFFYCLVGGDGEKIVWQKVPTIFGESSFVWMEYSHAAVEKCVFQA